MRIRPFWLASIPGTLAAMAIWDGIHEDWSMALADTLMFLWFYVTMPNS